MIFSRFSYPASSIDLQQGYPLEFPMVRWYAGFHSYPRPLTKDPTVNGEGIAYNAATSFLIAPLGTGAPGM